LLNPSVERSQPTFSSKPIQIAVVGDVHGQWDDQDESALISLGVDLVLFVGDFGNEAVELVEQVAEMSIPVVVALGNHDAWFSATAWGRQKCPYDRRYEDRVQQQLELLGASHIGYSQRDFPQFQFGVVGGRPFSWGGPEWKYADFYSDRFDVHSMEDSCDRIVQAAQQSRCETLIFVSHNGPTGLGDQPEAPCGRDWMPIGGDYGDPDLQTAIATIKSFGKKVALVTFGHMHHALRHTREQIRQRIHIGQDGTLYLNAACVPRVLEQDGISYRNFSLVSFALGQVVQVQSVWVSFEGVITSQELLYAQPSASDS
jgi:uncharacterized protein (TIGR04168 family)